MPARRAGAGSREPTGLTRPGVRREAPARACRSRAHGWTGRRPRGHFPRSRPAARACQSPTTAKSGEAPARGWVRRLRGRVGSPTAAKSGEAPARGLGPAGPSMPSWARAGLPRRPRGLGRGARAGTWSCWAMPSWACADSGRLWLDGPPRRPRGHRQRDARAGTWSCWAMPSWACADSGGFWLECPTRRPRSQVRRGARAGSDFG